MLKPVRVASRLALGAVTAFALLIGGMPAPAFAEETPLSPPATEVLEEPAAPGEAALPIEDAASEPAPAPEPGPEADAAPEVEAEAEAEAVAAPEAEPSTAPQPESRQSATRLMMAPAAPASPSLEVFLADGTTPVAGQTVYFGDTLVVRGSNYDPLANERPVGGRPPIPEGVPGGTYVVFGHFGADWEPSTGAASSLRKVGSQKWAISQASFDLVPTMYQSAMTAQRALLNPDGSFETTLTVTEPSSLVTGGSYGVYTYAAGGATNAVQELAVMLTPKHRPSLEVFLADGTTPVAGQTVYFGDTLVVRGSNYDPLANERPVGGRPPIPEGVPGGTYVVFGHFGADWEPSTGAASSLRKVGSQKWAISQASFDLVPTMYQSAITAQRALLNPDGSFETTLTVTEPSSLVTGGSYGVYTYAAGGATNAVQERAILLAPTVRPATTTTMTLTASAATLTPGGQVTLTATVAPTAAVGTVTFTDGATVVATAPVAAGTATVTVTPSVGAHSYQAQFTPSDASAFAASTSSAVAVHVAAPVVPGAGSLSWAIKSSFNQYMVTVAAGSVAVSGGAAASGGGYWFPQSSSSGWSVSTQTGSVPFGGAVHFVGHAGALDVTFANPTIVVHSASSATLMVNGSSFAALNLAAASKSTGSGGEVTWSGVPATLTASGAAAFAGFYSAGEALDSLTFTAGSANSATGGGRIVVASAPAPAPQRTPAATPPATTGVKVVSGSPTAGGMVTIEAGGYQPNETGIIIVVYSEPVVLGTVTADAAGVARWTGKLPSGLSGTHTLTMQGSVSHGAVVTLRPQSATMRTAAGICEVSDATLTWGFKESFRAYLSSAIANGEWTVADGARYETPDFSWSGAGTIDPATQSGELAFDGSIRFTGHDGVLDTTVSTPRIVLSADGAVLLLDVTGTTQDGSPVDSHGVEFATLDLAAVTAEEGEGTLTWTAIPAVLTEAGAAAFGTYPAGEVLDPLTVTITLPADCLAAADAAASAAAGSVDGESAGPDLTWVWWVVGGIALLAIAVALGVFRARRATRRA